MNAGKIPSTALTLSTECLLQKKSWNEAWS